VVLMGLTRIRWVSIFGGKGGILEIGHQNEILSLTAVTCWAFIGYD